MDLCPECGFSLKKPLHHGAAQCGNCCVVFTSSSYNRILSAGWSVRKRHYVDASQLQRDGYTSLESELAISLVYTQELSHDELVVALKRLGIERDYIAKT